MRNICNVALPVLLGACTVDGSSAAPSTAPTEVASAVEAAPAVAATQPVEVEEVGQAPADPGPQPTIEVVRNEDFDPNDHDDVNQHLCPYAVEFHAFPAISEDGTTLLAARVTDFFPHAWHIELTWIDGDGTRRVETFDCEGSVERGREQADELNAKLASQTWRAMERLDALYSKPGIRSLRDTIPGGGELAGVDEVLESLPVADRPVEVFYHAGYLMARVRDAKVLQKTPEPEWPKEWYRSGYNSESCEQEVLIDDVAFDRVTGIAVVDVNFDLEGGCLCNDAGRFVRSTVSDELIAEADRRSTEKFMAAMTAAVAEYP